MTMNMDTRPVLADGTADGPLGTPHLDDGREGQGPTTAEMSLKGRPSRRKNDNQTQDVATGTSSIVPPPPCLRQQAGVKKRTRKWMILALHPSPEKIHKRKYVTALNGRRN
jgi:hypothetical protein